MERRAPAAIQQTDGREQVFGDRVGGDTVDRPERPRPQHGRCPAPERRVPTILAGLEDPVEQPFFGEGTDVLERIEVVEVLRGLDDRDPRIIEVRDRGREELRRWHVIGIEDGDQVGLDGGEGVVEVAGLRVCVGRSGQIASTDLFRHLLHPRSATVVEYPGLVGRAQRHRRGDGRQQDVLVLVVGGDAQGDGRRAHALPGGGTIIDRPGREQEEAEAEGGVQLEQVEEPPDGRREGHRGRPPEQIPDDQSTGRDGNRTAGPFGSGRAASVVDHRRRVERLGPGRSG